MESKIETRYKNVTHSVTFRNIVSKFGLDTKAVLDIGCSYGEFLTHFGLGSVGLTISKEEMMAGKSRGLDIRVSNIEEETDVSNEKFDVIFANNILEHMQSPHNFLLRVKGYLKTDGLLILGVPCIPYLAPLLHLKKFRGSLTSLHINFFTRATMIKTVEFAGWEVLEARGFHFLNRFLDYLLIPIYPHFYVVAKVNLGFEHALKRLKELEGYIVRH